MRRRLPILLMLLLVMPSLAPLLALASGISVDASLPACCRRAGAHHCAMSPGERARLAPAARIVSAPPSCCPFRSVLLAPSQANPFTPAPYAFSNASLLFSHKSGIAQTRSRLRIARARTAHKRGPPRMG